jgi:hypothetical protein
MKSTFKLPHGCRLVVQPAAAGRSVQITFHPDAASGKPAYGMLVPNDLAAVFCQAVEAVAEGNEARMHPPELPAHALAGPLVLVEPCLSCAA